jgi:hypothetical protein
MPEIISLYHAFLSIDVRPSVNFVSRYGRLHNMVIGSDQSLSPLSSQASGVITFFKRWSASLALIQALSDMYRLSENG